MHTVAANGSRRRSLSVGLADKLRRSIANGEYPIGNRLPPEPQLARGLGVSRATLREALKLLEREGVLARRPRVGTTVSARPVVENSLDRNYSVQEMIETSGKRYGVHNAQFHFTEAPENVASELGLDAGAPVMALERTRTADGIPVIFTIDHLDLALVEQASAPLLPDIALYDWLHDHCGIAVAHAMAKLQAIPASSELATRLEIETGEPLVKLSQIDYTAEGRPVLHSQEFHVANVFELSVIRTGPYA